MRKWGCVPGIFTCICFVVVSLLVLVCFLFRVHLHGRFPVCFHFRFRLRLRSRFYAYLRSCSCFHCFVSLSVFISDVSLVVFFFSQIALFGLSIYLRLPYFEHSSVGASVFTPLASVYSVTTAVFLGDELVCTTIGR